MEPQTQQGNGRRLVKSFETLSREYAGGRNYISGDMIVDQLTELRKALATQGGAGFGDQTPLRLENLDATMTSVLFQASHLKLFNSIPRVPSAQILYQWIRALGYGTQRGNLGFREGGVAQTGLSSWIRGNATVRYLGVKRGFTHQVMQVGLMGGAFVDPVAREHRDGTLQLLAGLERNILFGDSLITDASGTTVNYDGLLKQTQASYPSSIFDMHGQPLDFEALENYTERLVRVGKLVNFDSLRMFTKPRVLSDLAKLKIHAERKMLGTGANTPGYRPGTPLRGYDSQQGYIPFEQSIFLDPVDDGKVAVDQNGNNVAEGASPPAAPASATVTVNASDPASLFDASFAGTYYYWVTAAGDGGESLATAGNAGAAIATGGSASVAIPATQYATVYRVYRGTVNSATDPNTGWIANVVPSVVGGAATYTDENTWIPQTGIMLLLNMEEPDLAIAQMAPLIKFPLAVVSTTIEFMLMLYHTLAVKAPERVIIVKNIGYRTAEVLQ